MEGFNATEVLQQILDEARVPLIRRTIRCADATIAAAEVSGEDSKAKSRRRPKAHCGRCGGLH
jgi:hypothetical protein